MPAKSDFRTPDPNDVKAIRARNNRLAARLADKSDDIIEIYLETLPSGRTKWCIVLRDGRRQEVINP